KSLLVFLIIGGLNTIISVAGSQLLLAPLSGAWGETGGYWGSTAIMFALCSIASFYFNRKYSFESKAPLGQSILRFSVVILVCYLLSFGFSHYVTPLLAGALHSALSSKWVTRLAMLIGQVIFTGLNYIGQRLWAFKE
ncbi:MAG: GtrA family protein, partial [Ruthenibacterium sp.]